MLRWVNPGGVGTHLAAEEMANTQCIARTLGLRRAKVLIELLWPHIWLFALLAVPNRCRGIIAA